MKCRLPSALVAILSVMSVAVAAEPVSLLHVVEIFTLPTGVAMDLLDQDLPGAELRQKLITMTKDKPSTLEKMLVVRGQPGERLSLQQTEEYLYPVEFDPPQVPQQIAIIDPGEKPSSSPVGELAKSTRSPFNGGLGTMTTTTPTAFEMRPLGDQFVIDPALDNDGSTLRCEFSLQTTKLLRVEQTADIPRPVFSNRKLAGKITLAFGVPAFLGTYDSAGHSTLANMSLAFLTVRGEGTKTKSGKPSDPFQGGGGEGDAPLSDLRLTFEAIALDLTAAHALIAEGLGDAALHDRLAALIANRKATRETMVALRVRSGVRMGTGNHEEFSYPTEFDPPQMPQNLFIADHQLIDDLRHGRQSGVGAQPPMEGENPNGGFGLMTSLSPTAFEMTQLGERLEFDPVVSKDQVDVTHTTEFRRLAGKVRYNGLDHPVFENRGITARASGAVGTPVLLGTYSKAAGTGFHNTQPNDRVWFGFLHVRKL